MDDNMNQEAASGPYIWLRYATQYTKDGQTHTVEMSVPIPIGASVEARERLLREAEAGMGQLINHVELRGNQQSQRAQNVPTAQGAQGLQGTQRLAPQPASNTRPPASRPVVRPAATSAPQTTPLPPVVRDGEPEGRGPDVSRQNALSGTTTGVSRTPGRSSEMGGNMQLPHFIQYIKENLDLTPKQAMELLKVRSLSTGINLHDALEQLKVLTGRDIPGANGGGRQDSSDVQSTEDMYLPAEDKNPERSVIPMSRTNRSSAPIIEMRVGRTTQTFDEEVGPEEGEESEEEPFDDLEDLESSRILSRPVMEKARSKLDELRESQGAATASAGRLLALNNVAISQVTEEQLQELVDGVWGISSLKKLKVDQVEALISWAKLEDDFAEQVEAVLIVLEEEHYARGNR